MGCSVYILTSKKANKIFRLIFERDPNFLGSFRPPVFQGSDLAYAKTQHRTKAVFGLNFSGEWDLSNAIVSTAATLLGRDKYWYDGEKMFNTKDAFWWHRPLRGISLSRRLEKILFRKEHQRIDMLARMFKHRYESAKLIIELNRDLEDQE